MKKGNNKIILAVETSCDDTCASILKSKNNNLKVLSNIISSQIEIHKKWGGVYPALAKREHQRNLVLVLEQALNKAKLLKIIESPVSPVDRKKLEKILEKEPELLKNLLKFLKKYKKPDVDIMAVTIGPGLDPCLWVGVNFAKALSYYWGIPIVPVNHIEAHILANFLEPKSKRIKFPAIVLIVSGGHTQLILMKNFGKYEILGETRDDAAGECFDKIARILGLGYPGGPAIAAESTKAKKEFKISLPRPMIYFKNYDFSFSGLKTAVLYDFKKRSPKIKKSETYIQEMCAESQQAVIDVLIHKTLKAIKDYKVKTLILGGGVAANQELRKQFQKKIKKEKLSINFNPPNPRFCTDNAVMIGIAGYYNIKKTKPWENIITEPNLRIH